MSETWDEDAAEAAAARARFLSPTCGPIAITTTRSRPRTPFAIAPATLRGTEVVDTVSTVLALRASPVPRASQRDTRSAQSFEPGSAMTLWNVGCTPRGGGWESSSEKRA